MEKKKSNKKILYILLALSVAVIWGMGFIMVDFAVGGGLGEWALVGTRFFAAGILLFFLRSAKGKKTPFCKRELLWGASAGVVNFIAFLLQTMGMSGAGATDSGRCALFTATYVIIVSLLSCALDRKFRVKPVIDAVVFFVGMLILTGWGDGGMKRGDWISLCGSLFFALQIILVSRAGKVDFFNFNAVQLVTMGLCGLVGSLFTDCATFATFAKPAVLFPVLYLAVFSSAYAYMVQITVQKHLSESLVAILLSLESLMSVVFSLLFGNMTFSLSLLFGCLIMSAACVSASLSDKGGKSCE